MHAKYIDIDTSRPLLLLLLQLHLQHLHHTLHILLLALNRLLQRLEVLLHKLGFRRIVRLGFRPCL